MILANKKRDRYRPQFCDPKLYQNHHEIFSIWANRFAGLPLKQRIALWLLGLLILRRPNDWYAGSTEVQDCADKDYVSNSNFVDSDWSHSLKQIYFPLFENDKSSHSNKSALELLYFTRIKAEPPEARRALIKWLHHEYPLIVLNHIPTASELLKIQCQGQRVLTWIEDYNTWSDFKTNDRDYLSFLLHDFIHAEHFFNNNQSRQGQLAFYKSLEAIFHRPNLQKLLENSEFSQGFEYLMSDMNAHPIHLLKTLNALVKETLKDDLLSSSIWLDWTNVWSRCFSKDLSALQKINTQLFCDKMALEIDFIYGRLGQSSSMEVQL